MHIVLLMILYSEFTSIQLNKLYLRDDYPHFIITQLIDLKRTLILLLY